MENTIYYRDETNLKHAPTWAIWLNMINLILALMSGFMLIADCNILPYIIITWVLFFSVFSDMFYEYLTNLRYTFCRNEFIYEYDLNKEIIPSSNTTVKIVCRHITRIKRRKEKVTVWGYIKIKRPLQKVKIVNKVTLMLNFGNDSDQIYEKMKDYIIEASDTQYTL